MELEEAKAIENKAKEDLNNVDEILQNNSLDLLSNKEVPTNLPFLTF